MFNERTIIAKKFIMVNGLLVSHTEVREFSIENQYQSYRNKAGPRMLRNGSKLNWIY